MRPSDLTRRLLQEPFEPFRIHLADGTKFQVERPQMLIVGRREAIVPTRFGRCKKYRVALDWQTVALDQVVQCTSLPGRRRGNRQRRKPR